MQQVVKKEEMKETVYVGVGEIAVSNNPDQILSTSLGSCVAVILLAPGIRAAGIAHIALPTANVNVEQSIAKPGYYADTGIPKLLAEMDKIHGGKRGKLLVKLVGGANIMDPNNTFDIGKRNILGVKKILWENRLGVLVEDTGEDISRNIKVYVDSGKVIVNNLGKERAVL
jgi:chemotaxis protein CheD